MKNYLVITLAALLCFAGYSQAQTTIPVEIQGATNWCAIPYLAYDTTTRHYGGGGVVLYSVTPMFWAGVRAQSLNGQSTTAGVQAQLQTTITIAGVHITPFVEASTGMGNSALYSNAGTGGLISFGQWHINKTATLEVGIIGDYEHYVYGDRNGNQINAGPMIHLSF